MLGQAELLHSFQDNCELENVTCERTGLDIQASYEEVSKDSFNS